MTIRSDRNAIGIRGRGAPVASCRWVGERVAKIGSRESLEKRRKREVREKEERYDKRREGKEEEK